MGKIINLATSQKHGLSPNIWGVEGQGGARAYDSEMLRPRRTAAAAPPAPAAAQAASAAAAQPKREKAKLLARGQPGLKPRKAKAVSASREKTKAASAPSSGVGAEALFQWLTGRSAGKSQGCFGLVVWQRSGQRRGQHRRREYQLKSNCRPT